MRTAVFSTKSHDRQYLLPAAEAAGHELAFLEPRATAQTAVLARGFPAICTFVNDLLTAEVLPVLAAGGTRFVALRCAGFNQVDLESAASLGIRVARVPAYSPHAVAEHTIGMMLALNRKYHKAFNRVREGNFSLEGLLGFDMHGRTAGVIGTGKIGAIVGRLLACFGCRVLLYDIQRNPECKDVGQYVELSQIFEQAEIITLHCPLTPQTQHLVNERSIGRMRPGVMLVNTSRGALVDTQAVIAGLKSGRIGYLGLDVYEEEADLFFENLSEQVIRDDVFMRLLTFPNVLITSHQAFFTRNALEQIAATTMDNLTRFERNEPLATEVRPPRAPNSQ
jgi:D-lactate dehydrogenase